MQPVSVTVVRGGELVERVMRPLRRNPNGGMAAEYLGLVYPLNEEGCIDLEGPWHYPAEAPILLDAPEDLPRGARGTWRFEQEGQRTYIFLNGSRDALEMAARRLLESGFAVEHWGPSFRRGDGLAFDWFIRLSAAGDNDPGEGQIAQCLRDIPFSDSYGRGLEEEAAVDPLRLAQQLTHLEQLLAEEIRARDAAEAANEELRRTFQAELGRTRLTASFLRAALDQLRNGIQVHSHEPPETQPDVEALSKALEAARSEVEAALADLIDAEERRGAEAAERAELKARVAELEARLSERPAVSPRPHKGKGWLREVEVALAAFTPNLTLVRDSIDFMATEVADPSDLYGKLALLERDRTALKAKKVQAANGWMELHFSTGLSWDGRLYFRKGDAGAWNVLVSDKAAQPRDFQWMSNQ